MLYAFHEMQKSLGAPMRFAAQMGMTWAQSDGNPWKEMPHTDWLAASSELTLRLTQEYPKLPFGIHSVVDAHTHPVEETVVEEKAFCQLRRFAKVGSKGEPRVCPLDLGVGGAATGLGQPAAKLAADEVGEHAAGHLTGVVAAHAIGQHGQAIDWVNGHRILVVAAGSARVGSVEKLETHARRGVGE